jgi:hypothetical protein
MKLEVYCYKTFSDSEGTCFEKDTIYQATIIYDIIVIQAENYRFIGILDYVHNDWFLEHLTLHNVIPLISDEKQLPPKLGKVI